MFRNRFTHHMRTLLCLCIPLLLLAAVPVGAAPRAQATAPFYDAEWVGWGLSASFSSGTPVIKFAVYAGKNNPPTVLGAIVRDISEDCDQLDVNGLPTTLSINSSGFANFNGNVYIACETPNWQTMVAQLAPNHPLATGPTCECLPNKSPFWAAADFILQPVAAGVSRDNPVFDASELGVTFSLPTNSSVAQSRMIRTSGSMDSSSWIYDSTNGNRVLAGQSGPQDIAVIDYFGGLPFLTGNWRPYFNTTVRGNRFGQWIEPNNTGSFINAPNINFSLNTDSSIVYIGRNNSNGAMLHGRVRDLRVDPGCYAD